MYTIFEGCAWIEIPVGVATLVVNSRRIVIVAPGVPNIVAGCPLILTSVIPAKTNPGFAVSVTDAVYVVEARNGLWVGDHVTLPTVKLPAPVAVVLGAAPTIGVVTFIDAVVIAVGVVEVTVKLFVVAVNSPSLAITGLPWCAATDNAVPFAGSVVIPSVAKFANATVLSGASL